MSGPYSRKNVYVDADEQQAMMLVQRPQIAHAFGSILRTARHGAALSQAGLAIRAGLIHNHVGLIERGGPATVLDHANKSVRRSRHEARDVGLAHCRARAPGGAAVSSHKKGKRDKPTNKSPLPDLSPINEALHDAYCHVWTSRGTTARRKARCVWGGYRRWSGSATNSTRPRMSCPDIAEPQGARHDRAR
jgi:hypothetical protein